jgi:hypothetical protein
VLVTGHAMHEGGIREAGFGGWAPSDRNFATP